MPPNEDGCDAKGSTLLELAERQFEALSPSEKEFFQEAQEGREASMIVEADDHDPLKSETWEDARVIRGNCIAWLCTDRQARKFVTSRGIELHGIKVVGNLDLSHAKVEFSLRAERCAFAGEILLRRAELGGLYFSRCLLKNPDSKQKNFVALDAEGAKISGGLWLRDRCVVQGEVSLLGTSVSAELDCSDAHFTNSGIGSITADGSKIEGDVLLTGCVLRGSVRFLGATIGGNLDCGGSEFSETENDGLNCEGMVVEGDILLDNGFQAKGLVSLSAARVGGNIDCTSSQFSKTPKALEAEEAKVEGNVLFSTFQAEGEVNLARCVVGGNLECAKAHFLNDEDALTVDGVRIEGDVNFGESFHAKGEVRFFGAKIGGDFDCSDAKLFHFEGALSLDGAEVGGDVKFTGVEADGRVGLPGASIGGVLIFEGIRFVKNKNEAPKNGEALEKREVEPVLTAEGAKIKDAVFFVSGTVDGEVSLIGATVGGDLTFERVQFKAPRGDAISAHRATVGGNVFFSEGFEAAGKVAFPGAMIAGDLECKGAKFINRESDALSTESARIERSFNLREGLHVDGGLNLQNTEIRRCLDLRGLGNLAKVRLNLRSAVAGLVQDDEAHWGSIEGLELDGFTYERFHTNGPVTAEDWKKWIHQQRRQQRHDQFLPQPYEHLAAVLRRMGHERDAKRIMIAKNQDRARLLHFPEQDWWWYNFLGWAIGYGYAPWRAFVGSLAFIFLGYFLFAYGADGLIAPTRDAAYQRDSKGAFVVDDNGNRLLSKEYPSFSPFFYSLESFAPLLKLDQSMNWTPNANAIRSAPLGHCLHLSGWFLRDYLYCHIIFGWLLTSLWIGAITGLVKT